MNVKSECEIRPGTREQEIERDQCIPAARDIFTLFSVLLLHTPVGPRVCTQWIVCISHDLYLSIHMV